jgi:tRNA A37 threonylcarbamoyladenosine biosynthesis protein TsaE
METKNIIILKGDPSSGKSTILYKELTQLLNVKEGKKSIIYLNTWIYIYRMSLHENIYWENTLDGIFKKDHDIFIIPTWSDEFALSGKSRVQKTVEEIINEEILDYRILATIISKKETELLHQQNDNRRCAKQIFDVIQSFTL